MKVFDSIASLRISGGRLTVNYSGKSLANGNYLHFGWNNWANVQDAGMTVVNIMRAQYAQPANYSYVTLDIPSWANYIDFVICGNGIWDNNNSQDWHYSIRPLIDAQVTSFWNGKKQVTVYYYGSLNPVTVHSGIDGWKNVQDKALYMTYDNEWRVDLEVATNSKILNAAFRDNNNNWQNNFNSNWNINIE